MYVAHGFGERPRNYLQHGFGERLYPETIYRYPLHQMQMQKYLIVYENPEHWNPLLELTWRIWSNKGKCMISKFVGARNCLWSKKETMFSVEVYTLACFECIVNNCWFYGWFGYDLFNCWYHIVLSFNNKIPQSLTSMSKLLLSLQKMEWWGGDGFIQSRTTILLS